MTPFYQDELATLYLGNELTVLQDIPDGSVDLVVTSPPYNLSKDSGFARAGNKAGKWSGGKLAKGYGAHDDAMSLADYEAWQRAVLTVLWAKLSNHGAIFYNHKPRLHKKELWLPLTLNPGLPLRQIIIWKRPGGINFSPTHFCPTHEWVMVFAKPDYCLKSRGVSGAYGDVWEMTPDASEHPAPFPLQLPTRAILASANIGTVLDPYVGSGTTLRAASNLGVQSIGIDNDEWCVEVTRQRLAQLTLGTF